MGREMGFEPTNIGTTISLSNNIKRKNKYFRLLHKIIYQFINILWLHIGYMIFYNSPYMEDKNQNKIILIIMNVTQQGYVKSYILKCL